MSAQLIALRGLVRKELRQVRNDRRMLQVLIIAPMVQLFVFAYAANLDVATTKVAILDCDHSPESRGLASQVRASDSLEYVGQVEDEAEADQLLDRGKTELVLSLPEGYGKALASDDGLTTVQVIVDGSNSVPAGVGVQAAMGLLQTVSRRIALQRLDRMGADAPPTPATVSVRSRVLYNPELKSRIFLVPGILGTVLMLVTLIATSMAVVRERELGTLEQLLVTPVSRTVLVAGKLVPFALFGLLDTVLILIIADFWFRIPARGSIVLLLVSVVPFLLSTLGLGLLVSTVSRTQQQAMMTSMFFLMLPMLYLSGFIFPVESMPAIIQPVTEFVPLRHFLVLVRSILLKGFTLEEMSRPLLSLTGLGFGIFTLVVLLFRKRVD